MDAPTHTTVVNVTVVDCCDGGGIYTALAGPQHSVLLDSVVMRGCAASQNGGGIAAVIAQATLQLLDISVVDSLAGVGRGGAVFVHMEKPAQAGPHRRWLDVQTVSLVNNTAAVGGGLRWSGVHLSLPVTPPLQ